VRLLLDDRRLVNAMAEIRLYAIETIEESGGTWTIMNSYFGLPGGTRTPYLLLRRQLLYPDELRAAS
jgi:hypothetical protein